MNQLTTHILPLIMRAVLKKAAVHTVSLNPDTSLGFSRKAFNLVPRGKQSCGCWERATELITWSIFLKEKSLLPTLDASLSGNLCPYV